MKNEWINKIKENWIYIFALALIVLFVWIYSNQDNVLVESDNDNEITSEVEKVENNENVKGATNVAKKEKDQSLEIVEVVAKEAKVDKVETPVAPKKDSVTLSVVGQGSYNVNIVDGDSAFDVLLRAATTNGFKVGYKTYSFGRMVTQIGESKEGNSYYWMLYNNGASAQVGADDLAVKANDIIEWNLEIPSWY